jgi:predicted O-methyltransferase YrrM
MIIFLIIISSLLLLVCIFFGASVCALKKKYGSPYLNFYPIGDPRSPIPDIKEIRRNADRIYKRDLSEIPGVNLNGEYQLSLLDAFVNYQKEMPLQKTKTEGYRFHFDNVFFGGHDAILLYSLLRHFKPKKVIEIGSGYSSAVMLDTREAFPEITTEFTFIEPRPERLKSLLKPEDTSKCGIIEKMLQDVDRTLFEELQNNDMIFMDTSHQMKVGSEVVYILFELLPKLKPGVLIHFHDVFWPFEYPMEWFEVGRSWNEAYGLRAFLQYNDSFAIEFFNSYMGNVHMDIVNEKMYFAGTIQDRKSLPVGHYYSGGSLWLRKIK